MMIDLFTLGELYLSDFLRPEEQPASSPVELRMQYDDQTQEVRLAQAADPSLMYGRYWYRSGTNATMAKELAGIVESITDIKKLGPNSIWLDIASNDGTLLSFVPEEVYRIGVDPADESFSSEAGAHADLVLQNFFSADLVLPYMGASADVVTCIAMFYDLDDPDPFLRDVRRVLDKDGVFVLQMSYSPLMLQQVAFDNICHEHVFYYTLKTLTARLEKAGFRVMDCQLNDVNGGSFRVYAMRDDADATKFGTRPYRDVCKTRAWSIHAYEKAGGWNTIEPWLEFHEEIQLLKRQTVDFIRQARDEGKTVWAYGASTKGNTLLQFFGLDHTMIDGIAERSPYKYGLRTVGTDIPITDEETMRAANPDYLLVLPWHFISEFVAREQDYLQGGGKFIVPCPKFQVIGA